jgi:hypothetical protein
MRENWGYVYFQCKFYFLFSSKFFFGKILEIKRKIEKRKKKRKKKRKGPGAGAGSFGIHQNQ